MKKVLSLILTLLMVGTLAACGGNSDGTPKEPSEPPAPSSTVQPPNQTPAVQPNEDSEETLSVQPDEGGDDGSQVLVVYFSATGNTKGVAQDIAEHLGADTYEIIPETPYTDADLDYNTDCRANREQDDASARPAISGSVENMESYDVVFIGYPIWWGEAPWIISTFLESYDFNGKTIVPFCTSASSGMGSSAGNLQSLTDGADWLDGQRFSGSPSESDVTSWVDGLNING